MLGGRGEVFVWVRVSSTSVFSCYFSCNTSTQALDMQLDGLDEAVRAAGGRILIAGDFNAKSPLWGSDRWDERGEIVAEFLARLDLWPTNMGDAPNWSREATGAKSIIDITVGNPGVAAEIRGWRVLAEESLSDHRYIHMEWAPCGRTWVKDGSGRQRVDKGWVVRKLDKAAMTAYVGDEKRKHGRGPTGADKTEVDALMGVITRACDAGMPRRRPLHGRTAAHWWTNKIAQLRRECMRAREAPV
ncbi:uncharacterized protein [Neodiprion pinetum]|uniref:uncharacterized protein n=1 Tax=Neodiprion pinetum TaxID=441929 RepID=UPI00371FADEC